MRIGLDVGGTFTDCVAVRGDGTVVLEKAPTTPADQSDGVFDALTRLAAALGESDPRAVLCRTSTIVHGTTTADNALIQMRGAATGLLVTEGFRDEIELRRCYKEDIWDPTLPAPVPIARRRVRLEIRERLTAEGTVETPLDEQQVRAHARRLRAFGVTSIAVVFLHSYRNPAHELRARELILEEHPAVELISLSHEVYPKPPEFERTSTTLVNAFIGPPIVRYLERLETRLRDQGFGGELLLATCSGGVATPRSIARRAVATLNSGPTGGVVAASRAAASAGLGDVVSVDMGGTSYDVCLIRDGRPELKAEWNWRHRYCVALPMVDIHAIGAGGGSIARVVGGALRVGPESAGAVPGPVCYGRGGREPTVTDANLLLGRLDPSGFWGGRLPLDIDASRHALADLGVRLELDATGCATAIIRIVDAHMTDAIRRVLSLAGADPRTLDLVAFGGMGALHATTQAASLGMHRVLVPAAASGFSALGLLAADHVVDRARSTIGPWHLLDAVALTSLADELVAEVNGELDDAGVPEARRSYVWYLQLVYPGQTFDTSIPFERAANSLIADSDLAAAAEEFHRRNEAARLIETRAQEPVVRGIRLVGTGTVDRPRSPHLDPGPAPRAHGTRHAYIGDDWHEAALYAVAGLGAGAAIDGPAILVSPFTSIVLRPGDRGEMLSNGDVLVHLAS